jgi:hypothetical protein
MKYAIFFISLFLLFITCKKYKAESDDVSQDGIIRGRLFLYDTVTGSYIDQAPVKSSVITIAYDTSADDLNYLYSTNTDTAGYFVFNNLLAGKKYHLYYQQTINGIIYTADTSVVTGAVDIPLVAGVSTTLNNGIAYIFKDANGQRVPGVNACSFTSQILATGDTCAGSSFQLPASDPYGRTYKFDVMPGIYYNYIYVDYPNFTVKKYDTVLVGVSGFRIKPITLP